MIVSAAIQKMVEFYKGDLHDIDHFLKVWAMTKTIGELEGLDKHAQEILELAAVVHDIACPLCRDKYGDTNGKHQELESPPLVEAFFEGLRSGAAMWNASHGWRRYTLTIVQAHLLFQYGKIRDEPQGIAVHHGSCRHQCDTEYLHPCEV